MKSFVRGSLLVAAIAMAAATSPVGAQGRDKEIRLDMLSLQTSDGNTAIGAGFPGTLALAFYMNQNIAIEPQVGLMFLSGDGAEGSVITAGVFAPWYFAGDAGRTGFFVSPGVEFSKGSGDFEGDAVIDFGADLGLKMRYRENISTRFALTLRDGDSFNESVIGATFGVGLFWR
jgi:hypothetical protein